MKRLRFLEIIIREARSTQRQTRTRVSTLIQPHVARLEAAFVKYLPCLNKPSASRRLAHRDDDIVIPFESAVSQGTVPGFNKLALVPNLRKGYT